MMGLTLIQRYIFAENVRALSLVLGTIILAILLVDTVEQINTIGARADVGLLTLMKFSLMKLPMLIEQTLPFALLIAAMLTFRQLSKRAELPVIRASGLSAWSFLFPTISLAFIVGLFTMMVISPAGSTLSAQFENERKALLQSDTAEIAVSDNGIWMRDGDDFIQIIIHASDVDETGAILKNVRFIEEERLINDDSGKDAFTFKRRLDARIARLQAGFWQLEDVTEYVKGREALTHKNLSFPTDMRQATLIDRFSTPNHIGFWQLPKYIAASESVGIDASAFKMRYLTLTAIPIFYTAMALMGALACLRLVRLGGTAPFIAFGGASGIILFFVNQLGSGFGATGAIPHSVAAWSPPAFAIIVCLALIAFNEDG